MPTINGDRKKVNSVLTELLGSGNVYYDPPASIKMKYPAIRYTLEDVDTTMASNAAHVVHAKYMCTLIDRDADSAIFRKLLYNSMFVFDRHYVADNLHHYVFHVWALEPNN